MQSNDILRLSPSAIRAFRNCAYSYALGYVQVLPERDRCHVTSLALGSAVHEVIARFLRLGGWARRGKDELMAMLPNIWKAGGFEDAESEAQAYSRARDLLERFFDHPFPLDVERDLGIERSVAWHRPRRGILAAGKLDRICLRPGGVLEVIDYKTGRPPDDGDRLRHDVQALFYRSLAGESFRWLAPARTIVSFRYVGAAVTHSVEFDVIDFLDAWEDVLATVDEIRAARRSVAAGATLTSAFPLNRGAHCRGCQFWTHCDAIEERVVAAAGSQDGGAA